MTPSSITPGLALPPGLTAMALPDEWILAGAPVPQGRVQLRTPDRRVLAGTWECGPGRFRYEHDEAETVRIETGAVTIVDAAGTTLVLQAGDFAHFPAGTVSTWTIDTFVRKTFFIARDAAPAPALPA